MSTHTVYGLDAQVTKVGSLGIGNVKDESRVRFVTTFCGPANVIRVQARIFGQEGWTVLADLTGNVNRAVDVFTWDEIEVLCLVFDSVSKSVKVLATSFDGAAGPTFSIPDGTEVESGIVSFTSTDGSVIFSGDPSTGVIDLQSTGGPGGVVHRFSKTFNATSDWALSMGAFVISVPVSEHLKGTQPFVFILDSLNEIVEVNKNIDNLGNITINISASPDLRFAGKLVIF